jgi:hypothetical protein
VKWSEMSTLGAAVGSVRLYFRPALSPLFWALAALTVAAWSAIVRFIPGAEGP